LVDEILMVTLMEAMKGCCSVEWMVCSRAFGFNGEEMKKGEVRIKNQPSTWSLKIAFAVTNKLNRQSK
jgi:hypothetical protein